MQSSALTLSLRDIAEHVFHSLSLGVIVFDPELDVILRNQAATVLLPPGNRISDVLTEVTVESKYQNWEIELRQAIDVPRPDATSTASPAKISASETRMLNMVCTPLDDVRHRPDHRRPAGHRGRHRPPEHGAPAGGLRAHGRGRQAGCQGRPRTEQPARRHHAVPQPGDPRQRDAERAARAGEDRPLPDRGPQGPDPHGPDPRRAARVLPQFLRHLRGSQRQPLRRGCRQRHAGQGPAQGRQHRLPHGRRHARPCGSAATSSRCSAT